MKIKIEECNNGYLVNYDSKEGNVLIGRTKVYRSVDVLLMLEEVGTEIYGKKVKVEQK